MAARVEVTKKYARAYQRASKKDKGKILDMVVEVTGWNRDHARQQLCRRMRQGPGRAKATVVVIDRRKTRAKKYSYDAIKILQFVWATSGGSCGKYLAPAMGDWLDALEAHGHLIPGQGRYSTNVREELLAMSPATIDRYLKPVRDKDPIKGRGTTTPSTSLLRTSVTIRRAGDETGEDPGLFEVDTVAHCGPTMRGEFARSVNFTDVNIGWVYTIATRNNAAVHIEGACTSMLAVVPYLVTALDFDNGSEFMNYDLLEWSARHKVFFTRGRPYMKNDQATIESKNNHLVRRYGFYYRYDTPTELRVLNQLWPLVNDRLNFFTPTKKPTGYTTDTRGRRKRVYDEPTSPYRRLLAAGILSAQQEAELAAYKTSLDPLHLAREIDRLQQRLVTLAAEKTRALQKQVNAEAALPDITGIKTRTG